MLSLGAVIVVLTWSTSYNNVSSFNLVDNSICVNDFPSAAIVPCPSLGITSLVKFLNIVTSFLINGSPNVANAPIPLTLS